MSKATRHTYTAIWPGQPGGYVPTVADEMASAEAKAAATREKFGAQQKKLAGKASKASKAAVERL
jgi:hypothetical protein